MSAPVRIAVAGAGLIGRAHIQRIVASGDARLASIVDPSPAARALAAELGVPVHDSLEAALVGSPLDGLVVATPNALHVPYGLAAVEAGIPMLMEKPLSDDIAGGRRLVEAAERADVPVLVGHHHRHSPLIRRSREIVRSGELGRITAVHAMCLFKKPDRGYFEGAGAWRREPGGGVILINLIHIVDDLRNLCGEIASVQAAEANAARQFPVEDTAAVILRFKSGALGTLLISDSAASPWSWELTSGENKAYPQTDQACYFVAGSRGSISVPRLETWTHEGEDWWSPMRGARVFAPEADPLTLQMAHFVQVVRREAAPVIDAREGLRTLVATLAVKEAAASGGVIDVEPI
ncbi:Gfo/Idh/MocA family oxidoreductase [Alsobacter sp. SYSU M60028]|uniref:Gfo/Idh/MocA family oxidoreductase n=1 Tax=Alsobacter ponti TaxID=2962936 RepID=A0ABT1LDZ5_9HYPH|nr:Gfo/Idh/MocA family oxidoreductase [Alsobacter ponti]MCP8939113.1 Gfo/Idh/MocA family oxidoreductase [Alsobacter ponti]